MSNQPERKRLPASFIASLVVGSFVLPILVAWWYVYVEPPVTDDGMLNRGRLISPSADIHADPLLKPLTAIELAPSHWAVIAFEAGECGDRCKQNIANSEAVYRVLGHDKTRVKLAAVSAAPATPATVQHIVSAQAAARLASVTSTPQTAVSSGIVFLDWRGQVMIYFDHEQQPGAIKKDLKRLLRGSKIK